MDDSQRQLVCKGVLLDCRGSVAWQDMKMVKYPL